MTALSLGILGLGAILEGHAQALAQLPDLRVVAACDVDETHRAAHGFRAAEFAADVAIARAAYASARTGAQIGSGPRRLAPPRLRACGFRRLELSAPTDEDAPVASTGRGRTIPAAVSHAVPEGMALLTDPMREADVVETRTKIGVVGCGAISGAYLKIAKDWPILEVAACADLDMDRARARAEEYGVPKVCSVDELLADPELEIVVNLTIPRAHYEVAAAALEAGKSAYNEKPLAVTREDGRKLVDLAAAQKVRLGGAPDTFLGGGIQTCRKLIDDGWIGEPVAASAYMMGHGHESWHPDPEFYYKAGGGPMFDMGPYYLTALVFLMGPVRRATGMTRVTFGQRTITSQPKYGQVIDVEVPTHVAGTMEFANGAIGTITTSFDVWGGRLPFIEIYGTEGSLSVPNPNTFGGPVHVKLGRKDWAEIPLTHPNDENSRSIGVADMAYGLRSGRPHRANGDLTYHVLDLMHAFHDAQETGAFVTLGSTCAQPAMIPTGLQPGHLDP